MKKLLFSLLVLLSVPSLWGHKLERPNFIIIFCDDLGYQDLGCFESSLIKTLRIDGLAREGMRLTSCYGQPVCGPARAVLMTGSYPLRIAKRDNAADIHFFVHREEIFLSEILQEAGYACGAFGKWDLASHSQTEFDPTLMPLHQGFETFFGTPSSNDRFVNLYRNEELLKEKAAMKSLTERYTDEAIEFIEKNQARPFFVYLPHTMPHTRLAASERFLGTSKRGLYGDVVEEIDYHTGRLLDTLKNLSLEEKTYVVFTSDNGPWWIRKQDGGSALPLRSAKTSTWEGGVGVPTIIRAPGRVPAGVTCDEVISHMDFLPTFAALAGQEVPKDRVLDGVDVSDVLQQNAEAQSPTRALFYYQHTQLQGVREGPWKLVLPRPSKPLAAPGSWVKMIAPQDRIVIAAPRLYHLTRDISESTDLAEQYPQIVARLLEKVEWARRDIGDYNRVGENARFFDKGERRPNLIR